MTSYNPFPSLWGVMSHVNGPFDENSKHETVFWCNTWGYHTPYCLALRLFMVIETANLQTFIWVLNSTFKILYIIAYFNRRGWQSFSLGGSKATVSHSIFAFNCHFMFILLRTGERNYMHILIFNNTLSNLHHYIHKLLISFDYPRQLVCAFTLAFVELPFYGIQSVLILNQ